MFITVAAFSQKSTNTTDTSITAYLKYSCPLHPQYVSNVPAKCPVCKRDMTLSSKEQMKIQGMKLYMCPMDSIISTKPGKCPLCKMDMIEFKPKKN